MQTIKRTAAKIQPEVDSANVTVVPMINEVANRIQCTVNRNAIGV